MSVTEIFRPQAGGHSQANTKPAKAATAPFSMRLTEEERAFLEAHCGGRPWAAHIRECVFGDNAPRRRVVRRPKVQDEKLAQCLAQLGRSRLSSNLNQLAKSANRGTLDVSEDIEQQLADACGAIVAMHKTLLVALGLKPERSG